MCRITTREFARMIKQSGIDFVTIPDEPCDHILGMYTGVGNDLRSDRGVMEAALRSAHYYVTGEDAPRVEFDVTRGLKGVKEGSIEVAGKTIRIAVAHGLANVEQVLDKIRAAKAAGEETPYHFVEVMASPAAASAAAVSPTALPTNCAPSAQPDSTARTRGPGAAPTTTLTSSSCTTNSLAQPASHKAESFCTPATRSCRSTNARIRQPKRRFRDPPDASGASVGSRTGGGTGKR